MNSCRTLQATENGEVTAANKHINADLVGDLLSMEEQGGAGAAANAPSAVDLLQDLLGGDLGSAGASLGSGAIPQGSHAAPLVDLLGGGGGGSPTRAAQQPAQLVRMHVCICVRVCKHARSHVPAR